MPPRTPIPHNNSGDALNPEDYARKITEHEREFEQLKVRLDKLEDRFGNNEKTADTLCEVAEKASKMDEMLAKRFLKLLQNDVGVKNEVEALINKADRNYFLSLVKRVGVYVVSLVVSVFMIGIGAYINHLFSNQK